MRKYRSYILIALIIALVYTRFAGLGWGQSFPFHPDEYNMVIATLRLSCDIKDTSLESLKNCFNPHFFAYGQPPLYTASMLAKISDSLSGSAGLRIISALSSTLNALVMILILCRIWQDKDKKTLLRGRFLFLALPLIIFSPYFIQLAHFGTTESLLMLLYTIILYQTITNYDKPLRFRNLFGMALTTGLAAAIKISSLSFAILPIFLIISKCFIKRKKSYTRAVGLCTSYTSFFLLLSIFFAVIFSPHNLLNYKDFLSAMNYEMGVGSGRMKVFYTRQFEHTIPYLFHITRIFPNTHGIIQSVLFFAGFFILSWKKARYNILRVAFLAYFIPTGLLYAKWTRFVSPVFPVMTIFAILMFQKIYITVRCRKNINIVFTKIMFLILIIITALPGLAYLSIYTHDDSRIQASREIYRIIPENSNILSETANVIDIPVGLKNTYISYNVRNFMFYDMHENDMLIPELAELIRGADYVLIPSRRLFADHTCYVPEKNISRYKNYLEVILSGYYPSVCDYREKTYPQLNKYYRNLFSGKSGFELVKTVTSYPRIEFLGKTFFEFPDEYAEETWTVFDHPVIRIYKKM